jgi:hypothetical protein
MKSTLSAVLFIVGARLLSGQDVLHTLVPPPAPVASGASVRIALVGLNPTAGDAPFNKPLFLAGNLTAGNREERFRLNFRLRSRARTPSGPGRSRVAIMFSCYRVI